VKLTEGRLDWSFEVGDSDQAISINNYLDVADSDKTIKHKVLHFIVFFVLPLIAEGSVVSEVR
jgi:hypothetical protein